MTGEQSWRGAEVPVAADSVRAAILDGEAVLYNSLTARTLLLNSSLTAVWAAIDGVTDVAGLRARLAAQYSVTSERLRDDVAAALDALETEGFIRRRDVGQEAEEKLG